MGSAAEEPLSAAFTLAYTYTRSVGPVVGRFLSALRDGRLEGAVASDGRVLVPPAEADPVTGATPERFVEVGPEGVVTTWAWLAEPRPQQPLQHPFAWALIRLDGADSALLHAVDAGAESRMATGMRVRPRWREERSGHIRDLVCFEPVEGTDGSDR